MKSAGLTVISLVIALTGIYLSAIPKRKAELLKNIALFFSETARLCKTGSYSACEVLSLLSRREEFGRLTFLSHAARGLSEGDNIREIWKNAVTCADSGVSDREVIQLLVQFGNSFGRQSKEDFLESCRHYNEIFTERASMQRKSWEKSREGIVCSGILTGAAVFFIFM